MLKILLILLSSAAAAAANLPSYGPGYCDISDYGNSIPDAMDACCALGGGTVHVPKGTYDDTYPFSYACDNLLLELATDAHIVATTDKSAYDQSTPRFIYADHLTNIGLMSKGSGSIDGAGSAWWGESSTSSHPYLVYLYHCTTVTVNQITLQNSAKLTLLPKPCDDVLITNVTINNPYTSSSNNLDCIDPAGNNIHIKDCTLNCGDDNVAVKGPSSNVLVEDCFFGTGHGASVGSITDSVVTNVTFRNIHMSGTDNGCRIKTASGYSGGSVSDILFENITMDGVGHPVVIDGSYSSAVGSSFSSSDSAKIFNVAFVDISSTNSVKEVDLQCASSQPCKNITLRNVDLQPKHTPKCEYCSGSYEGTIYPEELESCLSS